MTISLTTPALLFPALSLLLLAYTNRFITIAGLIRALSKENTSCDNEIVNAQIQNLRKRIILIKKMQFLGIASLFTCVISMFFLLIQYEKVGITVFGISLLLMMVSLFTSMREITISVDALTIELGRCEIRHDGGKKSKIAKYDEEIIKKYSK